MCANMHACDIVTHIHTRMCANMHTHRHTDLQIVIWEEQNGGSTEHNEQYLQIDHLKDLIYNVLCNPSSLIVFRFNHILLKCQQIASSNQTFEYQVELHHSDLPLFKFAFSTLLGRTTNLNIHTASKVASIGASQYTSICSLVI
jgi:hypothetical protein